MKFNYDRQCYIDNLHRVITSGENLLRNHGASLAGWMQTSIAATVREAKEEIHRWETYGGVEKEGGAE